MLLGCERGFSVKGRHYIFAPFLKGKPRRFPQFRSPMKPLTLRGNCQIDRHTLMGDIPLLIYKFGSEVFGTGSF